MRLAVRRADRAGKMEDKWGVVAGSDSKLVAGCWLTYVVVVVVVLLTPRDESLNG